MFALQVGGDNAVAELVEMAAEKGTPGSDEAHAASFCESGLSILCDG